jgi:uncharacterized protein YndB with AHSA1/START domain
MPVTAVTSDADALTLTVVGDYPVPVQRLWDAYADPRQLERFWGPETWPATFIRHDMAVGGDSRYYMTGPEGSRSHGWWRFLAVEPGRRLEVEDGFAHEDGRPNEGMPTMRMVFTFEPPRPARASPASPTSRAARRWSSLQRWRWRRVCGRRWVSGGGC